MIALALLGVVLLVFWHSPWLWPLKILVVLFHELGHATAAWLSGGIVEEIQLNPHQGGHTITRGGCELLILNAGYLGSLLTGVGLLWASRRSKSAHTASWALAVAVLLVTVMYVEGLFGRVFSAAAAVAMGALARFASSETNALVLRGLGVFSVLYALFDIRDDVFYAPTDALTDATMLAEATGIPAVFWGAAWMVAGVALLWKLRKWLV